MPTYSMSRALGHDPKLLEVIEIPFVEAAPLSCQPENWLVETSLKAGSWKSHGMIEWNDIGHFIDKRVEFWHDTSSGRRRVSVGFPERMKAPASLYLIKPDKINSVAVWTERNTYPGAAKPTKRKRELSIMYQGTVHEFAIEDPKFSDKHYPQFPGVDQPTKVVTLPKPDETLLCVSLTGPWYGYHYKIAAGIFEPPPVKAKDQ